MWILNLNILYRKIDGIGDSYRTLSKEQIPSKEFFF